MSRACVCARVRVRVRVLLPPLARFYLNATNRRIRPHLAHRLSACLSTIFFPSLTCSVVTL